MRKMAKKQTYSIRAELLIKSREAMLSAVEIYNNPNIQSKAETFIMLCIVSWTYLMHAYYRSHHVDYRYYNLRENGRKKYDKTKYGAFKTWELARCIDTDICPLKYAVKENLRFLIGIRHEIEHQMTTRIDDAISAKFQACCINYNEAITEFFGEQYNISQHLSVSLQFSSIEPPQMLQLRNLEGVPNNIKSYIKHFDEEIPDEIYSNPSYSYRVLLVQKSTSNRNQADNVIEFVKPESEISKEINTVLIKEREKIKYLPGDIVQMMKKEGYISFNMYQFVKCWQQLNAKNNPSYGVCVAGKTWYWYEAFLPKVREYCIQKYGQSNANRN